MKQLNNESGITLIEVLAAITITAIISSLIYGVLFQTIHAKDKIQSHNELRQEANIVMTQLRTMHETGDSIWYSSGMLYKEAGEKNSLATENDYSFTNVKIDNQDLASGNSQLLAPTSTIKVSFIIKDHYQNQYELETVFPSTTNLASNGDIVKPPSTKQDFFTYLTSNNVFVYGSALSISGSTLVNSAEKDSSGTIVINNNNKTDLDFGGNNIIAIKNVYIDKQGNKVNFTSSTKLGQQGLTEIVSIKGNVNLNNGGAEINGDNIYIDGNVNFGSSAKITGKKVYISGNVSFGNYWGQIIADEIYIGGNVSLQQTQNIVGNLRKFGSVSMPLQPNFVIPSFREDSWYTAKGYLSTGTIQDGIKIYTKSSYTDNNWHSDTKNVVIVSNGDINITHFGSSTLTGVLFAPNGKVTFKGAGFKGVVIAQNGFFTEGDPTVTFINIDNFFNDSSLFPFQQ